MQLTNYEDIVRHLHKFPHHKLYVSHVDDKERVVTNVQLTSNGIEIYCDGKWIATTYVLSDLEYVVWNPPVEKKEKKKRKKKEKLTPVSKEEDLSKIETFTRKIITLK